MANSGKDSNTSQFFISFAAQPNLNFKHTIFGKVVGGMETLTKMEQTDVDKFDRPVDTIKIFKTTIYVNPFKEEVVDKEKKQQEELKEKEGKEMGKWYSAPLGTAPVAVKSSGIGKYIANNSSNVPSSKEDKTGTGKRPLEMGPSSRPTKKTSGGDFSNF